MELLEHGGEWLGRLGTALWSGPMALLFLGTGLYLTARLRGRPLRCLGYCLRETLGKALGRGKAKAGPGEVSPFQALCAALGGSIGTGNVAGVTAAITLGGPGALFWIWVSAAVGMTTKYAEVLLAMRWRRRERGGAYAGGAMYYITGGLGRRARPLAVVFALGGCGAAFAGGGGVQAGNIAAALSPVMDASGHDGAFRLALGLVLAALAAVVLLGGAARLGAVCQYLVPLMGLLYLTGCLYVILCRLPALPHVLREVAVGAFCPEAAAGGAAGIGLRETLSWGLRRGLFSHEAGLGSSPMIHASSQERDPARQGLYGVCEVFVDTVVVCSATGLCLLCAGLDLPYGEMGTVAWNVKALGTAFGTGAAEWFLAVSLTLFAFSSILTWGVYGQRCWAWLTGGRWGRGYVLLFSLCTVLGTVGSLEAAWAAADLGNALMALPNLLALCLLARQAAALTNRHFLRKETHISRGSHNSKQK